jgi:hypothetical protein
MYREQNRHFNFFCCRISLNLHPNFSHPDKTAQGEYQHEKLRIHGVEKPVQFCFGTFSFGGERSKRPKRAIVQTYKYYGSFEAPVQVYDMSYTVCSVIDQDN